MIAAVSVVHVVSVVRGPKFCSKGFTNFSAPNYGTLHIIINLQ